MSKMLLLGAALSNLHREGRMAWLWVTHQDMVRTCAAEEDCEGIVNFAIGIADIEAAAFLRELPEGRIRVSLRSKGKLNVAEIAERLGGGGHENAAGCTVDGPLPAPLMRSGSFCAPLLAHSSPEQQRFATEKAGGSGHLRLEPAVEQPAPGRRYA